MSQLSSLVHTFLLLMFASQVRSGFPDLCSESKAARICTGTLTELDGLRRPQRNPCFVGVAAGFLITFPSQTH